MMPDVNQSWQRGPSPPLQVSIPKQTPSIKQEASPAFRKAIAKVPVTIPVEPPVKKEPELPPPLPTPAPSAPSKYVLALTRLVDLEAQMEFAFAKHLQLVTGGKRLHAQTETLQDLPVGMECFNKEYDVVAAKLTKQEQEQTEQAREARGIYDFDE